MNNIGLLLIATHKYTQFVAPLLEGIKKNFLPRHNITVYIFTDKVSEMKDLESLSDDRVKLDVLEIPGYKYPQATLYRYKIFNEFASILKKEDYLFYTDVDMAITGEVGDEILISGLVAVRHPGFYAKGGWGSPGNSERSTSYLKPEERKYYYAGGFQGGRSLDYLKVCEILDLNIKTDENNNVMAEWHDETHWNYILNKGLFTFIALTPSYCMVEQQELRNKWGISYLEPRIVALAKNHAELRS